MRQFHACHMSLTVIQIMDFVSGSKKPEDEFVKTLLVTSVCVTTFSSGASNADQ